VTEREPFFDADGHVMEPGDLWERFVEPPFRDCCITVTRDVEDGDKLLVAGRPASAIRRLGGMVPDPDAAIVDWSSAELPRYASYSASCTAASYDPVARLAWMDAEGITATFLFPSLGLLWPRDVDVRSPYARAHFQAYNRWISEFSSADPGRLFPVGQLCFADDEPIESQVAALLDLGVHHAMLPHGYGDATEDEVARFWHTSEHELAAVHIHKAAMPHFLDGGSAVRLSSPTRGRFFHHIVETLPGYLCLSALFDQGVPDIVQNLRIAFHECNSSWVSSWIARAEESHQTLGAAVDLQRPVAHYFDNSDIFFFSTSVADLVPVEGPHRVSIMAATDYPHPGAEARPLLAWLDHIDGLAEEPATAILHDNAYRLAAISAAGGDNAHSR